MPQTNPWKLAFIFLSLAALAALPALSLGSGIIWDEWIQSHYGKLVLKFLMSGGRDLSALDFGKSMYLYGGFFDTLCAAAYGLIYSSIREASEYPLQADFFLAHWHDVRHVLCALFGFVAIFFAGLTAKKIGGWRAGAFALILMLLSPRFVGNAFNNPKDIPFAAAMSAFIYFIVSALAEMPRPRIRILAGLAASIALAINIRAGGLLFLFYAVLFFLIYWLKNRSLSFVALLKFLIPTAIAGYFAGLIFWPYAWQNPFLNPASAFFSFSKFSGAEGTLLFEGRLYTHGTTPWYYTLKWILISSPLFFTAALFIWLFAGKKLFRDQDRTAMFVLIFCAFFPLLMALAGKSVVYDAWRHFLFVYPPLIVLAALAFDWLFSEARTGFAKTAAAFMMALLLAEPMAWILRNHPNEYVYFSPLVGGLRGAQGRYETDYWGNCLRAASEKFGAYYKASHEPAEVVVNADGEPISSVPFLARELGQFYVPYAQGQNEWQYSIEFARGKNPGDLRNGNWPGPNAVYAVTADQVPLCAVIEKK